MHYVEKKDEYQGVYCGKYFNHTNKAKNIFTRKEVSRAMLCIVPKKTDINHGTTELFPEYCHLEVSAF